MKGIRKSFLLLFFFKLPVLFAQTSQPFAVVELFSSEGCSSCPPAEKLLSTISRNAIANHKNIFCLEYHVDYWNRGGWKDPFSKNQFTMRQNTYSSVLHERELYTPQVIVNGGTAYIGSDAVQVHAAIDSALKIPSKAEVSVKIDSIADDSICVHFLSSKTGMNLSLHFALVENNLTSNVSKGENAGKTFTHENIVRIFYSLPLTVAEGVAKIPLKNFVINRNTSLISFVQNKQTMQIIAAAKNNLEVFIEK